MDIDIDKTELIHFHRKRRGQIQEPHINLQPPQGLARVVRPEAHLRWLGMFFDQKLCWKKHVEIMSRRALSTISGLRVLANTIRGVSVANARLLYKTVVLPVLTFGSPVWYTGTKQKSLIKPLEHAQNEGLRWLLGAFRTTPSAEMHHIGAIVPIPFLLQRLTTNAATRLLTLPASSQVLARLPPEWPEHSDAPPVPLPHTLMSRSKTPPTIIHHLATLTHPESEHTIPYYSPPWNSKPNWGPRLTTLAPPNAASDDERKEYITQIQTKIHSISTSFSTLSIFTDGSRKLHRNKTRTGAGYVLLCQGQEVSAGRRGLGKRANVYDAEMLALAGAATAALEYVQQHPQITNIHFFSDNKAAVSSIVDTTDHPAQLSSIVFRRKIDSLLTLFPQARVEVQWVPGHKGIAGNERADELAKEAVALEPPAFRSTITWAREKARKRTIKTWQKEWLARPHQNLSSIALRLPPSDKLHPIHKNFLGNRESHARLIQAVTGHGFFGEYYARFVPSQSTACPCGEAPVQTREHILVECPLYEDHRHYLRAASRSLSLPHILGTADGLKAMAKFISNTRAFSKSTTALPPAPETQNDQDPDATWT